MNFAFSVLTHCETINGSVVGVSDGDTLTILNASNTQFKYYLPLLMRQKKRKPSVNAKSRSYPTSVMTSMPASKSPVLTVMDEKSAMLIVPASRLIRQWLNLGLPGAIGNTTKVMSICTRLKSDARNARRRLGLTLLL